MIISRSEIGTVIGCETEAWETYRRDQTGYVPNDPFNMIDALQGIAGHKAGEILFNIGIDGPWREAIADTLSVLPPPHNHIRTTLIRRAFLWWTIKRLPQLTAEWKPLGAEIPFKWEITPGFWQPLRIDDIMEHREHKGLLIYDFKFSGKPDLNWIERKKNSLQTKLYIKALQDVTRPLNRHVSGMMYECIEVGKWDDKKEIHKSPFVLGYEKNGKVQPNWVAGSKPVDLTEYDDEKWLKWAQGTQAVDECIWNTGIILPNDEELIRNQESVGRRVIDWAIKLKEIDNSVDPVATARSILTRNDEKCLQFGWGHACEHYGKCWQGHQLDLDSFKQREDHHK